MCSLDNIKANISTINRPHGFINYFYTPYDLKYTSGLLIFMGSYIYKEYRGKGIFKDMLKELFFKFPAETVIQVPVENKNLKSLFDRIGFKNVDNIEYWGKLNNAVMMEGILTNEMIKSI